MFVLCPGGGTIDAIGGSSGSPPARDTAAGPERKLATGEGGRGGNRKQCHGVSLHPSVDGDASVTPRGGQDVEPREPLCTAQGG